MGIVQVGKKLWVSICADVISLVLTLNLMEYQPTNEAVDLIPYVLQSYSLCFQLSLPWWPVLMRVASAYEVVTIPDGAAIPSALARDMGIAPEITRVRGRAGNMALVHVPFRAAHSVMP